WSGLGYDFLALRAVSRDHSASSDCFWRGTSIILRSAVPMILVSVAVASVFFDDFYRADLVATILIAELLCLRVTELIAKIFQGNGLYREMAFTRLANSIARLLVLGLIASQVAELSAGQWGWAYLVAALLSLTFSLAYLKWRIGISAASKSAYMGISDGVHFAAGVTSSRLSSEFDKALVLGLSGATGAGIYGAAYRLVSLAVAPVISFVNVVVTSLFKMQHDSQRAYLSQRSLYLCAIAVVYGAFVGVLIWLFLPEAAALLLGEGFRSLSVGLLPLALLPAAIGCRLVGEQSMAALNKLRMRTTAQWLVAVIAVSLNLALIPERGWTVAAWVLLAGEVALAACYVAAIFHAGRAGERTPA
ncbi:MAG: lipopolysaccharide biosynthesis protein, partial [Woeseiaceae bacterium]